MIDPSTVEIVYDIDDTVWAYVVALSKAAGVELEMWDDFYAPNNHWPQEVIERVNVQLHNENLFRNIVFFDGIEDILRPERELGVKVTFDSNCITKTVEDLKRAQLKAAAPDIRDDSIKFNTNTINQICDKKLSPNTFIFVDDNPYHIQKSTAMINLMLRWPWNTSASAQKVMGDIHRIQLNSLAEINKFVFHRTKRYLETGV